MSTANKKIACVGKDDEQFVDRLVRGLELRGISARHISLPALRMAPKPPDLTLLIGNAIDDGGAAVLATLGPDRGPYAAVMPSGALAARLEARQRGLHVVPRKDDGAETASIVAKLLADLSTGALASAMSAPPPPQQIAVDGLDWDDDEPETVNKPQSVPWRPGAGRGVSKPVPPPKPRSGQRNTLPGGVSFPPPAKPLGEVPGGPLVLDDVTKPDARPLPKSVHEARTAKPPPIASAHDAPTAVPPPMGSPHDAPTAVPPPLPSVHDAVTRPALEAPPAGDDVVTLDAPAGYDTLDDPKEALAIALGMNAVPSQQHPLREIDPDITAPQLAWRSPDSDPDPSSTAALPEVTGKQDALDFEEALATLDPASMPPPGPPALPMKSDPFASVPDAPGGPYQTTAGSAAVSAPTEATASPATPDGASSESASAPAGSLPPPPLAPSALAPEPPTPFAPAAPMYAPPAPSPSAPVQAAPATPAARKSSGPWIALVALLGLGVVGAGVLGAGYVFFAMRPSADEPRVAQVSAPAPPAPAAPIPTPAPAPPAVEPAPAPAIEAPTETALPEPAPPTEPTAPAEPVEQPAAAAAAEPAAPPPELGADADTLVTVGEAALRAQRYDAARDAFARAVALDDDNASAHAGLAQVAIATNDSASALTHADRVVRLRRLRSSSHVLLGDARRAAGDPGGARRAYQRALSIDPNDEEAQARLAQP